MSNSPTSRCYSREVSSYKKTHTKKKSNAGLCDSNDVSLMTQGWGVKNTSNLKSKKASQTSQ